MLGLSLVWIVAGALLGALALAARGAAGWARQRGGWPLVVAAGALGGLAWGWLGAWVYGRPLGTLVALWGAVLCALVIPWLVGRTWRARHAREDAAGSGSASSARPPA